MTLNDQQISALNEMIVMNIAKMIEHPAYSNMPNNMTFGTFGNLPSPMGGTINEWIGDAIMMSATDYERKNNGEEEEIEFSIERMDEITKKMRNQPFIDSILERFLPMSKAEINAEYEELFRKYCS